MLSLEFTFPAGRYHATPWDRHVNEGEVAWPPEPWRVVRALIATWHHKVKPAIPASRETLAGLVDSMASELPSYVLPPATHSHTRHYMPQGGASTALVFDAFTAVDRETPLVMTWAKLDLLSEQEALLDDLLARMAYLGRAESWVEARRTVGQPPEPTCVPGEQAVDGRTGEMLGDLITLMAPVSADEYQSFRVRMLADKRAVKTLAATLPERLVDALAVETSELRRLGWSQPPAARKVTYVRPGDALRPKRAMTRPQRSAFHTVQYALVGKPLPRVEDTLRIGELFRQAVMSRAKHEVGADAIPALLSGHGLPEGQRHEHAFFLPWDSDADGRLDRLLLHVPASLGTDERRIVERLRRLWSHDGMEWDLLLEGVGNAGLADPLCAMSEVWRSVTPYLHPWHVKKRFSVEDQVRRECRERGWPEPVAIERLHEIDGGGGRRLKAVHFERIRSKRGLLQADRHGGFLRLAFPKPVAGPIAIGFGCHFGLGLFRPA